MTTCRSEKSCIACLKTLPLGEFYAHPRMADGHLNKCKACVCASSRERCQGEKWKAYDALRQDSDKRRSYGKEQSARWRKANRAKRSEILRNARAADPEKYKARTAVGNALRSGVLVRTPCEDCGADRTQAHHEDYSRPLDVIWLCARCHGKRHRKRLALIMEPRFRLLDLLQRRLS